VNARISDYNARIALDQLGVTMPHQSFKLEIQCAVEGLDWQASFMVQCQGSEGPWRTTVLVAVIEED
jgi:hypothetical protein